MGEVDDIKIIGVIDEAPFDPLTWSGSSRYFFEAFKNHGILVDALSAETGSIEKRLSQLMSFHPKMTEWKRRYHLNTFLFNHMSKKIDKQLSLRISEFNVLLQVGAWYNFSTYAFSKDKVLCSYHDGNLATQIKRTNSPYLFEKRYIKRAFNFEKSLYHSMDLIFPMSEWLRKSFIEDFECDPDKVITVGAGINLEYVPEIEHKDYSRPNILFIGVDFERKGGKTLLEAFRKVKREIPEATLTIIGPELKGLPDDVTSFGRIRKNLADGERFLHDAYFEASLFVMPSYYEPFGIAFAEAMAHKLPCIGTDTCAMPEIIEHEKTGFIVPVGDSCNLADRILELLKNDILCKQFGNTGYDKYLKQFTWERVAKNIINSIGTIIKSEVYT